jgi:hypothetical protein
LRPPPCRGASSASTYAARGFTTRTWTASARTSLKPPARGCELVAGATPEQKEIQRLRKELARKEKALAETAALLVLRGKWDAFLAEGEEGGTPEKND